MRVDGVSLRVLESGPADAHPLILVHGWGSNVYSFAETIPALARAGHRVIAFDLPGHGLSEKPKDDTLYTVESLAACLLGVADLVGAPRFTFIGHSMGALLGLHLALRGGDQRVARLVLIGPAGLGRIPTIPLLKLISPRFATRIAPAVLTRRMIEMVLHLAYGTNGRPTERDIDQYWAPTQFDEFSWACRSIVHHTDWSRISLDRLRSLEIPVQVIEGAKDRVVRGSVAFARKHPGIRTLRVPAGGHLVMQECAVEVNAAILSFLRQT